MTRIVGRRDSRVIAAIAIAIALTGCSSTKNAAAPVTGGQAISSAVASSTAVPPALAAERAVLAKIREFYLTWAQLESDLTAPVEKFDQVLGSPMADSMKASVLQHRSLLARGQGSHRLVSGKLTNATLPRDPQGKPVAGAAAVIVRACVDLSGWDLKLPDGKSVLRKDRPQLSRFTFTLRNPQWPREDGWRITGQDDKGNPPCDKS